MPSENPFKLVYRPWKIKLNVTNPQPTACLVSLYDLLINDELKQEKLKRSDYTIRHVAEDRELLRLFINPRGEYVINGLSLEHDIIAYHRNLYTSTHNHVPDVSITNDYNVWGLYGINLSRPQYDWRHKPQKKKFNGWNTQQFGDISSALSRIDERHILELFYADSFDSSRYWLAYDKDAALFPNTLNDIENGALWELSGEGTSRWAGYNRIPPSVDIYKESYETPNGNIILSNIEKTLSAALPESREGYTTMCLNPYIGNVNLSADINVNPEHIPYLNRMLSYLICDMNTPARFNRFNQDALIDFILRPEIQEVLQDIYVWVKATFFADYISPDEFNQDLNQDADVVHNNLMLSSKGDFNRYDLTVAPENVLTNLSQFTNTDLFGSVFFENNTIVDSEAIRLKERSENRRPYIPKTIPSLDLLSAEIIDPRTIYSPTGQPTSQVELYQKLSLTGMSIFYAMNPNEKQDSPEHQHYEAIRTNIAKWLIHVDTIKNEQKNVIGALQLEPIDRLNAFRIITTEANRDQSAVPWGPNDVIPQLYHPGYYDPETRIFPGSYRIDTNPGTGELIINKGALDRATEYSHTPTVIPKDGNIITDGRILSPTIDELWQYIKRLVDGRPADFNIIGETKAYNQFNDFGTFIPAIEQTENPKDTRLPIAQNFRFVNDIKERNVGQYDFIQKIGDPLSVKVVKTLENQSVIVNTVPEFPAADNSERLVVDYFINIPDNFSYSIFDSLVRFGNHVTTFDSKENNSFNPNAGKRSIDNFTAWMQTRVGDYATQLVEDDSDNNSSDSKNKRLKQHETVSYRSSWGPRLKPYSLRELELADNQLKYNLITLARYLEANFALTSDMGKRYENDTQFDEAINDLFVRRGSAAHGTLYQFHKYYNQNVQNPNTVFAREKNSKTTKNNFGYSAEFSDTNWIIEYDKNKINVIKKERKLGPNSSKFESSQMTTDRAYYGIDDNLDLRTDRYSSEDVYLSASGEWRYKFDRVRIPVLDTLY